MCELYMDMKNLLKLIFLILITFLLILLASTLIYWIFEKNIFTLSDHHKGDKLLLEYNIYYYVAITVVTICVAVIAWVQLKNLHNSSQVNYLLEFDKKWGSEEIIMARTIIHAPYVRYQEKYPGDKGSIYQAIGNEIIDWSQKDDPESAKNFMYVLSLLNFFETVGYIHNKAGKTSSQIDKLMVSIPVQVDHQFRC